MYFSKASAFFFTHTIIKASSAHIVKLLNLVILIHLLGSGMEFFTIYGFKFQRLQILAVTTDKYNQNHPDKKQIKKAAR